MPFSISRSQLQRIWLILASFISILVGIIVADREHGIYQLVWTSLVLGLAVGATLFFSMNSLIAWYVFLLCAVPLTGTPMTNPNLGNIQVYESIDPHIYLVLLLILFFSFLVRVLTGRIRLQWRSYKWTWIPWVFFVIVITGYALLGFFRGNQLIWIIADILHLLPYIVLLPIAMLSFGSEKPTSTMLVHAILFGFAVHGLLAVIYALLGQDFFLADMFIPTALRFRIGTSNSHLSIWAIPLWIQVFLGAKRRQWRYLTWCTLPLILFVAITGSSRTYWALVALETIYLLYRSFVSSHSRSTPIRYLLVITSIVIAIILFYVLAQQVYGSAFGEFSGYLAERASIFGIDEKDIVPRVEFYSLVSTDIREAPMGRGLGWHWNYYGEDSWVIDNIYLFWLGKAGPLGFLAWACLLLAPIFNGRSLLVSKDQKDKSSYDFTLVLFISLLATVLAGLNIGSMVHNQCFAAMTALSIAWIGHKYATLEKPKPCVENE